MTRQQSRYKKPSRPYWLLQLASRACLCLATLPQGSAEQVKGPEVPQIRLEVTSSKLKDSSHTAQLSLTNLSTTAIDPAQYRLIVRGRHDQAVKVYGQNTLGEIVELALEKPIDLASLMITEALPIGEVSMLTLISKPSKDTSHLELILSIEDALRKTVSKSVSVTWRRKRPQTGAKILIGVGLIAVTAFIIMLRCSTNPAGRSREGGGAPARVPFPFHPAGKPRKSGDSEHFQSTYSRASSISTLSRVSKNSADAPNLASKAEEKDEDEALTRFHSAANSRSDLSEASVGSAGNKPGEIGPEDIVRKLVEMTGEQDTKKQLSILRKLLRMPAAKERLETINEQIGKDPTLDKLLKHWKKVTWGTALGFWGVGERKIQTIIKSLDLEALLAKLLEEYGQDISKEIMEEAKKLLL